MKKVRLGKTNLMVSELGFGGIPIQRVSESEAVAVVRRCLELGITFIDTANGYTNSEIRIGKAISGQREKIILATKSAARTRDEIKDHLKLSLKHLRTEYIDLYQFHGISEAKTLKTILDPEGPISVLKEAVRAGVVRHVGFSSHQIDTAKEAVKSGCFESIMFPLNVVACEAESELLSLCREHDVGFIAMKPLAGGMLGNIHVAFKYLCQFPDVIPVVGIEKIYEVEEIVQILEGSLDMTEVEQKETLRMRNELGSVFCRRCDYCQPCNEGITISQVMMWESVVKRLSQEWLFSGWLADIMDKAANCTQCGECEEKCPYNLPIMDMMKEYVKLHQAGKREYEKQFTSH